MAFKTEKIKPSEYHPYSETIKQDDTEIVTRKSFIHQSTKCCLFSQETHFNPNTNQITEIVNRKFHPRLGNMIQQTIIDYKSGIITTENWSPTAGAKEPQSIIQQNLNFHLSPRQKN